MSTVPFSPADLPTNGRRRTRVVRTPSETDSVGPRLRRVHGQLAGIIAMNEDGRYCIDILDQLSAVRAALDAVALVVLERHIDGCVRSAIEHGSADEAIPEMVAALRRYVRSA